MKKLGQQNCASCGEMKRCRHRDFSPHAWAVLLHWEEISTPVVGQPLCNGCYTELRDLLIDRAEDIEKVISNGLAEKEQSLIEEALAGRAPIIDQPDVQMTL